MYSVTDELFHAYSISYGNEGVSLSDSDVDCYDIIRKLLEFVLQICLRFIHYWEIQTYLYRYSYFVRLPTQRVMYPVCRVGELRQ
jgi:hypothetical protein